jgi:hypothetical protein
VVASAIRDTLHDSLDVGDAEVVFFNSDEQGTLRQPLRRVAEYYDTLDIPACVAHAGYTLIGWREDAADDYVASIERVLTDVVPAEWGAEVLEMLAALRKRVTEAEATGYRRGVIAAREVWLQKEQAIRELQSVDRAFRGLLPGGGDR